jgi:integrase
MTKSNVLSLQTGQAEPVSTSPKTIPELIESLNSPADKIRIRAKNLKNGSFSVYLDYIKDNDREYFYLGIILFDLKEAKEQIRFAQEIRNAKQRQLFENEHGFRLKNDILNIDFIEYFAKKALDRQRPDKSWKHTLKYLKAFTKDRSIPIKNIDVRFCESFRDYLTASVNPNTSHIYFAKLKAALNMAVKDDILVKSPAQFIKVSKQEVSREFLTIEELRRLNETACSNNETKQAFLFACFTGLRISDLKRIKWTDIQNGYLQFRQQKTQGVNRLKLHQSAIQIITAQHRINDKVFQLISDVKTSTYLKKWAIDAGLEKNMHWHIARHTFACLSLNAGNDVYTVSKLLGHSSVKITELYVKLIDSRKDDAVDKLPGL